MSNGEVGFTAKGDGTADRARRYNEALTKAMSLWDSFVRSGGRWSLRKSERSVDLLGGEPFRSQILSSGPEVKDQFISFCEFKYRHPQAATAVLIIEPNSEGSE